MSRLLPEWLNANFHKSYPFAESTAAAKGALPTTFLLDMQVIVSGPVDKDKTFISRVENTGTAINLYLKSDTTDLGLLAQIPINTKIRTDIPVALKNGDAGVLIDGYVTVGDANIGASLPAAVTELTLDNGKLHPGVVLPVTNWAPGLIVGDELYSGNVALVAGTNVKFRAVKETINGETVPVIYVDCDAGFDGGKINTDEEMLEQIRNQYGDPIYTLNGVAPDDNGNVQLSVENATEMDDETDVSTITLESTTGSMIIKDNRTKPCCTLDDMQIVIDNIAAVNERAARLESLITEMETNLNSVSAQLAIIGTQR